jgi:dipeptidyl aminopeptidase/acylaminoacyl peptidase
VGEADAGVWVVDRIPLWFDAVGFVHHLRRQLHLVDSLTSEVESLTPEEFNVICHAPSPDGRRVAYAASVEELDPRRMVLKVLDLESREVEEHLRGFYIESLCWTDDGHVAFIGNDLHRGYSSHNTVWLVDLEGGELQNLTGHLDRGCSRRIYYDLRSPYATYPGIRWDDGRLYFTISEGGRHNLYRMRPDGQPEPVVEGDLSVDEFSVSRGVVAYIRVAATEPGELWVWEAGEHRRLTNFNGPMLRELKLSTPERIEFKASDGAIIEGWMLRPINQEADRRYPLIMDIHGGPKSKYGYSLMFEHQLYAAKGYVVLYTNPRGSYGYTEEFADIRRRYGTRDYQDLMEAIDHILKHYDFIDPECLGVTGLSYGGFMTNWVVTHTDRFRVAISQNGIADWRSFYWTTDIGFYFAPDQIGGTPWTNEEAYREKSPITYATQVNTPIMFVHSYHDYRCWIDQSIGFYTALKTLGKETRLTLFTEGSHVFRSLAKPSIRKERLKQMLKWFDNHLKD